MKNLFTYLKALWSSMVNSQKSDMRHDRRLTVGSPSGMTAKLQVNSFMRFAVFLTLIFTIGVGNAWGQVASATATTNGEYVVAVYSNSKYYALPNISGTASASTFNGEEVTVNSNGEVTTENPPLWKLTVNPSNTAEFYISYTSSGTTYYLYKNGTTSTTNYNIKVVSSGQHYWTFTAGTSGNAGKYQVISKRGSANTALAYTSSKWKVSGTSGYNIILLPVASSCSNKVTINKGTESYGTFELNKTGEQNACDALSVTVTPEPDEHYHVASVSATNPATTGTAGAAVDNGDGTWTITYSANSKGASTVSVTFAEDSKASITLSEAGATTTDATTYYVGDTYTLPSSTEATCGTKVLVGWSTVTVAETDTKPTSNFYEKGASVTLEASQTFYAVFATASSGGTNPASITLLPSDFGTSYPTGQNGSGTITKGDYSFTYGQYTQNSNGTPSQWCKGQLIQARCTLNIGLWNTTAMDITSVVLYKASPTSGTSTWAVYEGTSSAKPTTGAITVSTGTASAITADKYYSSSCHSGELTGVTETPLTYTTSSGCKYINIAPTNGASYFTKIVINYNVGGGTTYSAYSTSCEACTADPTVGTAQLNGAFSLSNFCI